MGILEAQLQKRRSSNVRKPEEEAIIPDQCHLKKLKFKGNHKMLRFPEPTDPKAVLIRK